LPDWVGEFINHLFVKMRVRYESTYHRTWKDDSAVNEAKRNWAKEVSHLTESLAVNGTAKLFDSYPEWPPNLNSFIALCKKKDMMAKDAAMYKPVQKRLPKLTTDEEKESGKKALKEMRAKLNMG